MKHMHRSLRWRRLGFAAVAGLASLAGVVPSQAAPWNDNRQSFATPAFNNVWDQSDRVVAEGRASRSWTWGPRPFFDYKEFYRNSPNGLRQVQYFDKARMEINNPSIPGPAGVTNGLLTVEMVSGRIKLGDGTGPDENGQRQPAQVPVAGDPLNVNPNSPTYASFAGVASTDNGYRDADRTGQRIGTSLDKQGNRTNNAALANDPATEIVAYNTVLGHNIPRVFRDFINNGPVDGLFAFGYAITDPYWIKAKVGGVEKDVFVQLYERRVLTYTPSNPNGFKVEMGNVGQHYFQWRYPHLGQPWIGDASLGLPIAFASKRATADHWETFVTQPGANASQVTNGTAETVPYSWRRSYIGGQGQRLMTDSRREYGVRRVFSINYDNTSDVQAHSPSYDTNTNFFNPAISPDGNLILFAALGEYTRGLAISTMSSANQGGFSQITPYDQPCEYQSPAWLPDGSGIVYVSNCSGKQAIYRADLQFQYVDPQGVGVGATLVNTRVIVSSPNYDNFFPRVSPDGTQLLFNSNREGQNELYVIGMDGRNERRLTNNPADDGAGSWSRDGMTIVFDSNRDGDYELYTMRLDDPARLTQITNNTVDDRWAVWYQ